MTASTLESAEALARNATLFGRDGGNSGGISAIPGAAPPLDVKGMKLKMRAMGSQKVAFGRGTKGGTARGAAASTSTATPPRGASKPAGHYTTPFTHSGNGAGDEDYQDAMERLSVDSTGSGSMYKFVPPLDRIAEGGSGSLPASVNTGGSASYNSKDLRGSNNSGGPAAAAAAAVAAVDGPPARVSERSDKNWASSAWEASQNANIGTTGAAISSTPGSGAATPLDSVPGSVIYHQSAREEGSTDGLWGAQSVSDSGSGGAGSGVGIAVAPPSAGEDANVEAAIRRNQAVITQTPIPGGSVTEVSAPGRRTVVGTAVTADGGADGQPLRTGYMYSEYTHSGSKMDPAGSLPLASRMESANSTAPLLAPDAVSSTPALQLRGPVTPAEVPPLRPKPPLHPKTSGHLSQMSTDSAYDPLWAGAAAAGSPSSAFAAASTSPPAPALVAADERGSTGPVTNEEPVYAPLPADGSGSVDGTTTSGGLREDSVDLRPRMSMPDEYNGLHGAAGTFGAKPFSAVAGPAAPYYDGPISLDPAASAAVPRKSLSNGALADAPSLQGTDSAVPPHGSTGVDSEGGVAPPPETPFGGVQTETPFSNGDPAAANAAPNAAPQAVQQRAALASRGSSALPSSPPPLPLSPQQEASRGLVGIPAAAPKAAAAYGSGRMMHNGGGRTISDVANGTGEGLPQKQPAPEHLMAAPSGSSQLRGPPPPNFNTYNWAGGAVPPPLYGPPNPPPPMEPEGLQRLHAAAVAAGGNGTGPREPLSQGHWQHAFGTGGPGVMAGMAPQQQMPREASTSSGSISDMNRAAEGPAFGHHGVHKRQPSAGFSSFGSLGPSPAMAAFGGGALPAAAAAGAAGGAVAADGSQPPPLKTSMSGVSNSSTTDPRVMSPDAPYTVETPGSSAAGAWRPTPSGRFSSLSRGSFSEAPPATAGYGGGGGGMMQPRAVARQGYMQPGNTTTTSSAVGPDGVVESSSTTRAPTATGGVETTTITTRSAPLAPGYNGPRQFYERRVTSTSNKTTTETVTTTTVESN